VALDIANLENQIDDLEFESHQEVPHKLTMKEAGGYSNSAKTHSLREATLEKHHGQVYALIYRQCTQLLQDKMKQEKLWVAVSNSYKPLELYKLTESVVLKQTKDQYPVAVVWDQYSAVFNAKQRSLSNTEWYEKFNTKVEVAELVGCVFGQDKILNYYAELEFKDPYQGLSTTEQAVVKIQARERFMTYGLLKTSSNSHDKIKSDLSDDFTKGSNTYPTTPQQTLLLLDKYSKKPTAVAQSKGTAFAQKGNKKGKSKKAEAADPKKVEYDKEFYMDTECFHCGKKGHPKVACTVKMIAAKDDKSTKSTASKISTSTKGSTADVGKMFTLINKTFKTMGKAMSQVSEENGAFADDDSIGAQSHALVDQNSSYAFVIGKATMRECLLLDNQSLVHVFCNPEYVDNIRAAERELSRQSNGGTLPISDIANFNGFEESVWYSDDAMINILSLSYVKCEYAVSYDREDFIIHHAKHGYIDMVFKPHLSGLHVYDQDDPQGHASYSFIATVEDNMSLFTKRQVGSADLACNLQAGLAYPSVHDLKWIVKANMLKDSPVTSQEVDIALKILGTKCGASEREDSVPKASIHYGRRNRGAKGNPAVTQESDFDH
jgi:hypothetical protein